MQNPVYGYGVSGVSGVGGVGAGSLYGAQMARQQTYPPMGMGQQMQMGQMQMGQMYPQMQYGAQPQSMYPGLGLGAQQQQGFGYAQTTQPYGMQAQGYGGSPYGAGFGGLPSAATSKPTSQSAGLNVFF